MELRISSPSCLCALLVLYHGACSTATSQQQHVVVLVMDVRQRRLGALRLSEVADDHKLDGQLRRRSPEAELVAGRPSRTGSSRWCWT